MPDLILPKGNGRERERRRRLIAQYGEKLVRDAEHDMLLGFLLKNRLIDYDEFMDNVARHLAQADDARRVAAGFRD